MSTRTKFGVGFATVLSAALPAQEITWAGLPAMIERAPVVSALEFQADAARYRRGGLGRSFSPRLDAGAFVRGESDLDGAKPQGWGNAAGSAALNIWRGGRDSALSRSADFGAREAELSARRGRLTLLRDARHRLLKAHLAITLASHLDSALQENLEDRKKAGRKASAGLTSQTDVMEFNLVEKELEFQKVEIENEARQFRAELEGLLAVKAASLDGPEGWPVAEAPPTEGRGLEALALEAEGLAREQEALAERRWALPSLDLGLSARRNRDNGGVDSENETAGVLGLSFQLWDGGEARALSRSLQASSKSLARLSKAAESGRVSALGEATGRLEAWNTLRPGLEARIATALEFRRRVAAEYLKGVKDGRDLEASTRAVYDARTAMERARSAAWEAWAEIDELAASEGVD